MDADRYQLGPNKRNAWAVNAEHADLVRPAREPRRYRFAAGAKTVTADASRTAVVVVDMQNDFCHPHGWLASIGVDIAGARAPIPPLAAFLPRARGMGMPVIWLNWGTRADGANLSPALLHVYNPDGASVGIGGALPATGARVLEKGSWSAAVVDGLQPCPEDIHVDKHRMSGFWDTPLDAVLRNLDVTTLLFGGVNADQCVLATLMDANFLGYDTVLLSDCSGTTSPAYCMDATVYNVGQCFGFVTTSTSIQLGE